MKSNWVWGLLGFVLGAAVVWFMFKGVGAGQAKTGEVPKPPSQ